MHCSVKGDNETFLKLGFMLTKPMYFYWQAILRCQLCLNFIEGHTGHEMNYLHVVLSQ